MSVRNNNPFTPTLTFLKNLPRKKLDRSERKAATVLCRAADATELSARHTA